MFELNFRDERYLPFEGAGAISQWRIELSKDKELRQFDYDTISDVIFHVRYTARDGVDRQAAIDALQNAINNMVFSDERTGLFRLFSAKHEFPSKWHKFLHPADLVTSQTLQLALTSERFPFLFRDKTININKVEFLLKLGGGFTSSDGAGIQFTITHPSGTTPLEFNPSDTFGGLLNSQRELTSSLGDWSLQVTSIPTALTSDDSDRLNPNAIGDIFIVCHYSVT